VFFKAVPTQDVANPVSLPSFHCRTFLSSLTLRNSSSLFTQLFRQIFSILLQHDLSKLVWYFWSIFRCGQLSALYRVCSKYSILFDSSFDLNPVCLWKKSSCRILRFIC
jgi:hypothetical protein